MVMVPATSHMLPSSFFADVLLKFISGNSFTLKKSGLRKWPSKSLFALDIEFVSMVTLNEIFSIGVPLVVIVPVTPSNLPQNIPPQNVGRGILPLNACRQFSKLCQARPIDLQLLMQGSRVRRVLKMHQDLLSPSLGLQCFVCWQQTSIEKKLR